MNEEQEMNEFCAYLEDLGVINYTDVWVKGNHPDLYGRTFTPHSKDRHRIEIYGNPGEHTNEEVLCHELAHVMLFKVKDGCHHQKGHHGKEFKALEKKAYEHLVDFKKG